MSREVIVINAKRYLIFFILVWFSHSAYAANEDSWKTFSDVGAYGLVGIALLTPTYKQDWEGLKQAGFSIGAASSVGLLGKNLVDEQRPDGSDDNSFPSNHTVNAFASATTFHLRYGWEVGLPAYSIATLVGVGRVEAKKHYWKDVFAGAVIGTTSAWIFTDVFDDSVQIVPWASTKDVGLMVSIDW